MIPRRALVLLASLVVLGFPTTARADTVTDWNAHASNAVFNVAGQPAFGALHMAMVQGAVYDAVNAIDGRHEPYLLAGRRGAFWASKDAAAATAAFTVLVSLFPSQQTQLAQLYEASLAPLPNTSSKWIGVSIGRMAAAAMIEARTNDGRFGAPGFPTGTLPGQWRPVLPAFVNDPGGWMRNVKPFLIQSSSQFRSAGPYPLASAEYAAEFNQVKSVGSLTSMTRTAFQTNSARYWAENPIRNFYRIMRTVAVQQGVSLAGNARLFALAGLATADALINVWDDKAFWSFWRPITAIREAHLDGNPATTADPDWLPLIATPPYPDHSSGASAVAGAVTRAMQHFFGTNEIGWSDTNLGGQTRSFTRFSDAMDEVVLARVWSGIHFLRPDVHGALIGTQVADWANANYFRRVTVG